MKKYNRILFLVALVLFSCKDDKDDMDTMSASGNPVGIVENSHTSGQTVSVDFRGRITNQQGAPIAGATVSAGGSITISNAQGFYQIEDAAVDDNYALVKVEYNGMFDQFRALKPRADQTNYVDIAMIQKIVNGFFSTASGGVINVPGGPTVSFPAGELVTSGGQPYSGEVLVASTYLDPSDPSLMSYMPGSLAAVDDNGEAVGMITYGMVGVELSAASNGQKLQLAGGRKATLTLPLPETHASHAPESIPLWYFDETAGIWQEEGVATRSGNLYVGQVSHFSFWNCDVSVNTIVLEGVVFFHPLDFALSGITVKLTRPDGSFQYTNPNSQGFFGGIIPGNEILLLEVITYLCNSNAVLLSEQIGPFSEDTDLGEILVETSSFNFGIVSLTGTIVDCDGNPMNNVIIAIEENSIGIQEYITTDEYGTYSASIPCLNEGVLQLLPSDLSELVQGEGFSLQYDISVSTEYDLGERVFCGGVAVNEYFNYSDGTNELSFNEVSFLPAGVGQDCGYLNAFLQGNETTDYVEGIGLSFLSIPDSSDFWYPCDFPVEVRGYLSSGEYMVTTMTTVLGGWEIIQQAENGTTSILAAQMQYGPSFNGGALEVQIYENEMSTTPLSTYQPETINMNFLVIHQE